jgi:hypothetical protein
MCIIYFDFFIFTNTFFCKFKNVGPGVPRFILLWWMLWTDKKMLIGGTSENGQIWPKLKYLTQNKPNLKKVRNLTLLYDALPCGTMQCCHDALTVGCHAKGPDCEFFSNPVYLVYWIFNFVKRAIPPNLVLGALPRSKNKCILNFMLS